MSLRCWHLVQSGRKFSWSDLEHAAIINVSDCNRNICGVTCAKSISCTSLFAYQNSKRTRTREKAFNVGDNTKGASSCHPALHIKMFPLVSSGNNGNGSHDRHTCLVMDQNLTTSVGDTTNHKKYYVMQLALNGKYLLFSLFHNVTKYLYSLHNVINNVKYFNCCGI